MPVQSQIFETDSQQIAKASANLLENETRDLVHGAGRLQLAKEAMGCADAHGVDLGDVLTLDPIMERVGFESTALAFGAEQISAIARQQHPNVHSIAPALQPAEPAANPFEVAVAVYDELLLLPGELAERFLGRNPLALAKFHQSARPPGLRNPGLDGALAEGFARVGDHEIQVDVDHSAETATGFARPQGAVEREEIGRRIAVSNIAMRTVQMVAERFPTPVFLGQKKIESSFPVVKGLFQGI